MARASAALTRMVEPRRSSTVISLPRPFIFRKRLFARTLMGRIWPKSREIASGGDEARWRIGLRRIAFGAVCATVPASRTHKTPLWSVAIDAG